MIEGKSLNLLKIEDSEPFSTGFVLGESPALDIHHGVAPYLGIRSLLKKKQAERVGAARPDRFHPIKKAVSTYASRAAYKLRDKPDHSSCFFCWLSLPIEGVSILPLTLMTVSGDLTNPAPSFSEDSSISPAACS